MRVTLLETRRSTEMGNRLRELFEKRGDAVSCVLCEKQDLASGTMDALRNAEAVLICAPMGPSDTATVEAIAKALGTPLRPSRRAAAHLQRRCLETGASPTDYEACAMMPAGSKALLGDGLIPGFACAPAGKCLLLLPEMADEGLLAQVDALFGACFPAATHTAAAAAAVLTGQIDVPEPEAKPKKKSSRVDGMFRALAVGSMACFAALCVVGWQIAGSTASVASILESEPSSVLVIDIDDWQDESHGGTDLPDEEESSADESSEEESSSQASVSEPPSSTPAPASSSMPPVVPIASSSQAAVSSSSEASSSAPSSSAPSSSSAPAESEQTSTSVTAPYVPPDDDDDDDDEEEESVSASSSSSTSSSTSSATEEDDDDDDEDDDDSSSESSLQLTVTVSGSRKTMDAYTLICQVVRNEMGTSFSTEALKAQAVATYTMILYNNQRGIAPSVTLNTNVTSSIKNAVSAVLGEAVYYNGSIANTVYHSTSAGQTTSAADVWGGSLPYLVSVDSSWDEDTPYYRATSRMKASSFASRVETVYGIDLYDYSDDPADWLEIESYTSGGYVGTVSLGGRTKGVSGSSYGNKTITGRSIRETLLNYQIRSHCFEYEYDEESDYVIFTTYGYGHGVGMSQYGAQMMALEGYDYEEILTHYYTGVVVK